MFFITMVRFRQKPKKSDMEKYKSVAKDAEKVGAKIHSMFFTLGRYDAILISECPDEKTHMKIAMEMGDIASSETMVGVPTEEVEQFL